MTVEIMPIARDDVDQALAYIAADNPNAADTFLENIWSKLEQVRAFHQTL